MRQIPEADPLRRGRVLAVLLGTPADAAWAASADGRVELRYAAGARAQEGGAGATGNPLGKVKLMAGGRIALLRFSSPISRFFSYEPATEPPGGGRRTVARAVAFGRVSPQGTVEIEACAPWERSLCLEGFGREGSYALLGLGTRPGAVRGRVGDGEGLRAGIVVEAQGVPWVAVSDAQGGWVLPLPAGVRSLWARERRRDLYGEARVELAGGETRTVEIALLATPPRVVWVEPAPRSSAVAATAEVQVVFDEPLDEGSVRAEGAVRLLGIDRATGQRSPVAGDVMLMRGGTEIRFRPREPLGEGGLYELRLGAGISDRAGHRLGEEVAATRFTTAAVLRAEDLGVGVVRVSIPEDEQGRRVAPGQRGRVLVCGGPQAAAPGTEVVVETPGGAVVVVRATDREGVSGSDACEVLFAGRCGTEAAGSFCAVVEGVQMGEAVRVELEDGFGNRSWVEAGRMRDERTGAQVVGPRGAEVIFAPDPRYRAVVPPGAFL